MLSGGLGMARRGVSSGVLLDIFLDCLAHEFAGLAVLALREFVEFVAQWLRQPDLAFGGGTADARVLGQGWPASTDSLKQGPAGDGSVVAALGGARVLRQRHVVLGPLDELVVIGILIIAVHRYITSLGGGGVVRAGWVVHWVAGRRRTRR